MVTDFFAPRLDFILFLYALGLFFLSAFSLFFFGLGRQLRWLWLSLFALSQALSVALGLVSQAVSSPGVLPSVGQSISALGFFFLILFGMHGVSASRGRSVGYVTAATAAALPAICSVFWGNEGFLLAVSLGLAPFAGALALAGIWRQAAEDRKAYGLVASVAPLLGLYVGAVTLIPLLHSVIRASMMGLDSMLQPLPTIPYAILLAVLIIAVGATFARSAAFRLSEETSGEKGHLVAYAFGLTAVGVAVFIGFAVTDSLGAGAEESMRGELYMRVSAVGNALDSEEVARLDVNGSATQSLPYRRLLMQLTKIRLANPDLRFVYLVGLRPDRRPCIVLDTEPPTSVDYAAPGELYDEAPDELMAVFSSGKTALVGPYTDRWGTWISGFAPVKDEVGAIMGVVGMDIAAKSLQTQVAMSRFVGLVITFLLAIIGAAGGLLLQRNKDLAGMNARLATEVQERVLAEQGLADSERKYRHVVEMANDGIAVLSDGVVRYANPGLAQLLLTTVRDLQGQKSSQLFVETERNRIRKLHDTMVEGGPAPSQIETVLLASSGRHIPVELSAAPISFESAPAQLVVFRDVTVRKKAEDALRESEQMYRELSFRDDLTSLYNSRLFMRRMMSEIDVAEKENTLLSLVLMDIDDFKSFNDTYGHVEGDEVLRRLGGIIRQEVRVTDMAFRYGGEEFVVLLPGTDGVAAVRLAERIRLAFEETRFGPFDGSEVSRTLSLGVAVHSKGEAPSDFLGRADRNMYQAKGQGKNATVWEEE